jgi:hypothetical protein
MRLISLRPRIPEVPPKVFRCAAGKVIGVNQ